MNRPHGHLPIFTDEHLKEDLEVLSPYFCKGRCVQIEADAAKQQAEWDTLSQDEKAQRIEELRQLTARLIEFLKKEVKHADQASDL